MSMSKIKFTILDHGIIETDLAYNVALPNPGSLKDKNPKAIWAQFPCYSVLIHHAELGWVLYDTGFCPGDESDRLPESFKGTFPLFAGRQDYLESRLKQAGLSANDISLVILSHMHWDHAGGVGLFGGTKAGGNIIAPGKDFALGVTNTHKSTNPIDGGYIKGNFEFPGLSYNFIDEDYELAEGLELVWLEGHTPSILGLMLKTDSGTYIFPSDAVATRMNYGPPYIPTGLMYDSLGFARTIKKLYELERKHKAAIMFSHDIEQYRTFKKAPEFYE